MKYQNTFRRYEIKYLLEKKQKQALLTAMAEHMQLDKYGRTTIRNIYFDTDSFRLVRRSNEKPSYKEKFRLRSYLLATPQTEVFAEIKKKYNSVVYKRRLTIPEGVVTRAFAEGTPLPVRSQIGNEIDHMRQYYENLKPRVFLSYEREAYYSLDGSDFRVTFDENILYRTDDLSLCSPPHGTSILPDGMTLMEVKTAGALPLWLTEVLSKERIFKTSFSKYGTAYLDMQMKKKKGVLTDV